MNVADVQAGSTSPRMQRPHSPLGCLLRCLWFYFSWQPTIKWVSIISFCVTVIILLLALLLSGRDTHMVALGLVVTGIFGLAIPFCASGIAFRKLVSSRQYSLVPTGNYTAFLALLVLTMFVIILPAIIISMLAGQWIYIVPVIAFILASLFLGLTQLNLPSWSFIFLGWLPIIIINTVRWLPPYILGFFTSPPVILISLTACLAGWILARRRMRTGRALRPTRSSLRYGFTEIGTLDPSIQTDWLGLIQSKHFSSASDSLYYNMQMNMAARIRRVGFPMLIMMIFVIILSTGKSDAPRENFNLFFLLIILIGSVMSMMSNIELLPRSKLLWLRMGRTRRDIWNLIESNLFRDWAVLVILSSLLMFFIRLIQPVSLTAIFISIVSIICCLPFFSFYPMYLRQSPSGLNTFITGAGVAIATIALMICSISSFSTQNYQALKILDVILLGAGITCRIAARRHFDEVDWLRLKPRIGSRLKRWG